PNVLRAAAAAREMGMRVIALAGRTGGRLAPIVDVALVVEADSTQRIQETHITIGHILCEIVEESLYPSGGHS
ncbi:MAG TPA: phosphoheptose isomerase, partial [Blastocatellia bacterium]|nr:phosphoheptose isomerase [Blastocatellia bacterium]